ncbi:MAG TPA: phosphoethanolamine--lipid A transferase [Steroidobacteraceae bacterium]
MERPDTGVLPRLISACGSVLLALLRFMTRGHASQQSTAAAPPAPIASRLTGWLSGRIRLSSELLFIVAVPALWLVLYNLRFWRETIAVMWHPALGSVLFIVSLFTFALLVQTLLLLFLPSKLLRAGTCVLFILAALVSYFSNTYGVFMDKDMMRNIFATDTAEVTGLLTLRLFTDLLLLGLLPCLLIWRIELPVLSWRQRLKQRSALFAGMLAVATVGLFALSPAYASFFRQHKSLRYLVNPMSAVYSAVSLGFSESKAAEPMKLVDAGGPVTRVASGPSGKPLVLFLVIGETARAADFQLGGYEQPTNPELARVKDLIYFRNTASCGTSTAISLPCIFFSGGRKNFNVDDARHTTNLLDMLSQAGVQVEWLDNQSGCKGVCARVSTIQYTSKTDSPVCKTDYCYDQQLQSGLTQVLGQVQRDSVFVFHQIGSHGPAYAQRYPAEFEVFKPACHSSQLDRCSQQEVRNAYDNTILYTDHNLAQQIEVLRAASDHIDSLLIYVSDHGESLGENGVYLHGVPYALAPVYQKHVPLMMWMSPGFAARWKINTQCMQIRDGDAFSHDNIFHTVMGAFGVRNAVYRKDLDMLSGCVSSGNRASGRTL